MTSDTLGSAEWGMPQGTDLKTALEGNAIIFGHSTNIEGDIVTCNVEKLICFKPERHFLSVAPTRSGKGVSLILPNLLSYKGSIIVIDPKGENAWISAQYRRDVLKQKVYILDPWHEVNRRYGDLAGVEEKASRFNPLSILDPNGPHYADDLAYLADALILSQSKNDPFFDESARELVAGLMAYCAEEYKGTASLPLVRGLLTKPSSELAGIAKNAKKFGAESVAVRKLERFTTDSKTNNSIIATALSQTAFLDSEQLAENLEKSDFSFNELTSGQATIYLVLPVDKLQTYGRWLRLLVSIGIRTLARNVEPLELPVLFMLDEFGTIGRLSAVAQAFGLMAGLKMCVWAFVQDVNQLKRDYPDEWETFIGNSEAVTIFDLMDQSSCDYFSRMLGTATVERISQATANVRQPGAFKHSNPNYSSMNDQVFARPLKSPEEIRQFLSEAGIIIGRFNPLRFYKVPYFRNNTLLLRARPDPHFPAAKEQHQKLAQQEEKNKKALAEQEKRYKIRQAVPNAKKAIEVLKKKGYTVEKKGLFSKSFTVWTRTAQKIELQNEEDFLTWTYKQITKQ